MLIVSIQILYIIQIRYENIFFDVSVRLRYSVRAAGSLCKLLSSWTKTSAPCGWAVGQPGFDPKKSLKMTSSPQGRCVNSARVVHGLRSAIGAEGTLIAEFSKIKIDLNGLQAA